MNKMNKNYRFIFLSILILICLSCASVKNAGGKALLPMKTGWYLYEFERTFKGIEDEYNLSLTTKMKIIQELTWKYTGVVCYFEDGVFYDPVTGIELSIDNEGQISCTENISIKGRQEKNGRFFWSGLKEEHGRLNSIFVKGTLRPLSAEDRAGGEYDGVYQMTDSGTKRKQLVNIKDGFYTWKYIDGEETGFTPWPLLVHPDGSIVSSMEIITVIEMGELSKTNYSTNFSMKGKIVPGQGISMEEVSRSAGALQDQRDAKHIYAGTMIRSGEYPNEAIPADIENLVKSGRAAIKKEPKPNPAKYPSWYIKLPVKHGFIYAAGEKTFAVQKTAFALAEAAAAANIAEQIQIHIESSIMEVSDNNKTRIDERIKTEAVQQLNYKIIERYYNEETRTAFILVEMALE
ncbi:MAG: hypothetical protein LBV17_08925 [Treponema sp.]|jgi:hypothetical protein|nr:hypothetical protein [Treponema sp.]